MPASYIPQPASGNLKHSSDLFVAAGKRHVLHGRSATRRKNEDDQIIR